MLRALVTPQDPDLGVALERANRWPGFNVDFDPWPDLPDEHDAAHRRTLDLVDAAEFTDGRRPEASLLRVDEHIAQLARHHSDVLGYQQWYLFDSIWAGSHPDLAQSLLRYANDWDPLADRRPATKRPATGAAARVGIRVRELSAAATVTSTGRQKGDRAVGRVWSPQEKKALSYARDRRNEYGENDKSSRKAIRRRKRDPNRSDRHRERQMLARAAGGPADQAIAEEAQRALEAKKSKWYTMRWRKWPDAPLADIVEKRLRRRAQVGMADPALVQARIERIRRRLGRA